MAVELEQRSAVKVTTPRSVNYRFVDDFDADHRAKAISDADALLSRHPHLKLSDEEFN